MRIEGITGPIGAELQKVSGAKTQEKPKPATRGDSVSLSSKAKDLSSSSDVSAVRSHIEALPDIRQEKIQAAREKIASGYFNSPEFADKLADKLLKDFGLQA